MMYIYKKNWTIKKNDDFVASPIGGAYSDVHVNLQFRAHFTDDYCALRKNN